MCCADIPKKAAAKAGSGAQRVAEDPRTIQTDAERTAGAPYSIYDRFPVLLLRVQHHVERTNAGCTTVQTAVPLLRVAEEAKRLAQEAAERAKEAAKKMDQVVCEPAGAHGDTNEKAPGQQLHGQTNGLQAS